MFKKVKNMKKPQTNPQPFLTSHSIYLRVIEEKDVTNGLWNHWYNDYKLTNLNSHGVYPINIEDEREYFYTHQITLDTTVHISTTMGPGPVSPGSIPNVQT